MLTREEKTLGSLLKFWSFLFLAEGIVFAVAPHWVIRVFNQISFKFTPSLVLLPYSEDHFWLVLALSLMVTLAALCFAAQEDVRKKKEFVVFLLISKASSSLSFILFFFVHQHSLGYLLGMSADGIIFLITLIFYRRAVRGGHLVL